MVNNTLQKFLDQSDRKQNKILLDKVSEFDNRSMKPWLQENDTEMNSTNKEEKSVVVQRFIGTLKNKTYKYVTSISENVYIEKLADTFHHYNNTYHSKIKMKPGDNKSIIYNSFAKKNND